jgi:hypothetical protein
MKFEGKWLKVLIRPFTFILLIVVLATILPPLLLGIPPHQWYIAADGLTLSLIIILGGIVVIWYAVYYLRSKCGNK